MIGYDVPALSESPNAFPSIEFNCTVTLRASDAVRYPPPVPVASPSTLAEGELSKAVPTRPVLYTGEALCHERSPTADDAADSIEASPTVKFK